MNYARIYVFPVAPGPHYYPVYRGVETYICNACLPAFSPKEVVG